MGFHTFDPEMADRLDDDSRYRFCSREALLGAIGVDTGGHLLDLGSGTGFYTADLAPFFDRVSAVDIQPEMHELFRENGVPANVELITTVSDELPLAESSVDAAVSTMTVHELPLEPTLAELKRVLQPNSPVVAVDWSKSGRGESGPPRAERHAAATVRDAFRQAGFTVEQATERGETFLICAQI